jgi:ABC-2 type transport system ATP-binding protein
MTKGDGEMEPAITISGLSKRYRDVAALNDFSLDVPTGSVFGFLGPNGAGKSTALRILAGLSRATSGSATVAGHVVGRGGAHREAVGYLAQEPRFYGWMSGREVLDYVAGFYPGRRGPRAGDLLDLVGLTDAGDRPTRTYSGGMRQRLGIAQALAGDPQVLLLDEPAAALDPQGRHDVLALLERLRGDKTVFYSTHIIDDVQRISDHVAIIDHGRLVVAAPTAELVHRAGGGTLRVARAGAVGDDLLPALRALPGATGAAVRGRRGDDWEYEIHVEDGQVQLVQRGVMRVAGDRDLIVTANRIDDLDLEDVFLGIVAAGSATGEERAA